MGYVSFLEGISLTFQSTLVRAWFLGKSRVQSHPNVGRATDVIYRDPEGSMSEPSVLVIFVKQEDLGGKLPSGKLTYQWEIHHSNAMLVYQTVSHHSLQHQIWVGKVPFFSLSSNCQFTFLFQQKMHLLWGIPVPQMVPYRVIIYYRLPKPYPPNPGSNPNTTNHPTGIIELPIFGRRGQTVQTYGHSKKNASKSDSFMWVIYVREDSSKHPSTRIYLRFMKPWVAVVLPMPQRKWQKIRTWQKMWSDEWNWSLRPKRCLGGKHKSNTWGQKLSNFSVHTWPMAKL